MAPPPPSTSLDSLTPLHTAEQKLLASLTSASKAIRALAPPASTTHFSTHATTFLNELISAQQLIRQSIHHLKIDLPFENSSARRFIEADLSLQRIAHIHRSLVATLAALDEAPPTQASHTLSNAASPAWVPSPLASTPLTATLAVGVSPGALPGRSPGDAEGDAPPDRMEM